MCHPRPGQSVEAWGTEATEEEEPGVGRTGRKGVRKTVREDNFKKGRVIKW